MVIQNMEMDYAKKMQICPKYVEALRDEQKKIQVFQRELPLCLELVTQAIEACRKELSGTSTSDECSEQTTSVCGGPVFEEFMPIKKSSLSEEECEHDSPAVEETVNNIDKKKSDWLRSVQLWNPIQDPNPNEVSNSGLSERVAKKAKVLKVVEVKPKSGAFQPFQKEIKRDLVNDLQPTVKVAATTTTSSTTETNDGCKSDSIKGSEKQIQQSQTQTQRKQRRCWSPELHRRFLNALQLLGGSHVATPKQIRDHMKVDGLTNDEVKSHLQKYRIHTRRPTTSVAVGNSQQPQFVVVGGIWVPSPLSDIANNNGRCASTTAQPQLQSPQSLKDSVERSSGHCNSPVSSSSTNTTTTSYPVS